ncbi:MAG: IclR family transcriptional regulator [Actinomycetia bacterium]|nr:IclR family transcriptional regulator [Actinomycetes bacterium]
MTAESTRGAKKTSQRATSSTASRQAQNSNDLDGPDAGRFNQSLSRGLLILSLFDAHHKEWALNDLADQTKISRMTAYRSVRTLQQRGFLALDPVTNRYHLGPALIPLLYVSERYADLVRIAHPYLEALAETTGESVTIAVEIDGMVMSVDKVETSRPFQWETPMGPAVYNANSHAKILAAWKSPEEQELILRLPKKRLTPYTITDPQALATELMKVRSAELAFDMEERNLGTCSVAAPVRNQRGTVIAAVAVVAPAGRFTREERERCTEALAATVARLSAYLGWRAPGLRDV